MNPTATEIKLRTRSRVLEVGFDDGQRFELPFEYLRVHSPSAEVKGHGPGQEVLVRGKENVVIKAVEPVGQYAVKLVFTMGTTADFTHGNIFMSLGITATSAGMRISKEYGMPSAIVPELSVVIPTFNERGNVDELVARLDQALGGCAWEAIFVDDDSPDDTAKRVREFAQRDSRIRCLRRLHRRGLASACIEGMLASSAKYVAVMDADLQHDPALLPKMLQALREERAELVVGSRYVAGAELADWQGERAAYSRIATRLARVVTDQALADPMSGYFMLRRSRLEELAPRLSSMGFKILLDIVATAEPKLTTLELPLAFGKRSAGESKLTTNVAWEFVLLLADKLVGRWIPVRFLSFAFVGTLGLGVHFAILTALLKGSGVPFVTAQASATAGAIVFNYTLNNLLTYLDRPRRGARWLTGLVSFAAICSIGAIANVGVAAYLFERDSAWAIAALAGVLVGAVWNFAVSNVYTWRRH